MPKKFKGENSKAVEAKARKAEAERSKQEVKKAAAEDALWNDDDRSLQKKQQRKDDKEQRRLEQIAKKKELAALHDQEMSSIKTSKHKPDPKVTRHQLELRKERMEAAQSETQAKDTRVYVADDELAENLNRMDMEGEARTVDDAITVLGKKSEEVDMHPEKRMKAAYQEFEDRRLPELKKENGNLRLSQLRQMLRKEWLKSPINPLNARMLASKK